MKAVYSIFLCSALALMICRASPQDSSQGASTGSAQPSPEKVESANDSKIIRGYPIHEVNPKYPGKPRKKKARGKIVLQATIATDGSVKDVSVESGDPSLTPAAVDAVRQWRYLPDMRTGVAVESQTTITLEYDLGKGASQPADPPPGVPTAPAEDLVKELAAGDICLVGSGVTPPKSVYAPDPEYSEVARQAKFQGTGVLGIILGADGRPQDVWIIRGLGMDLDQRSVDVVKQWKFRPASKDGRPVAVVLLVETSFRLY